MFAPPPPPPVVTDYPHTCQTIERFVQDDKAKRNLRNELLPMSGVGRQRLTFAFVLSVVEQFSQEISNKRAYFSKATFRHLIMPFLEAARQVLQLNPAKVTVQATNAPGIYIFAEIDRQHLHIDLNFNEETGKFEEAVANIFADKNQKLNVFGTVEEVSAEIQNYFDPQKDTYENFIRTSYAIPGQTYSPYAF